MNNRILLSLIMIMAIVSVSFSQNCKVELPGLQGTYEGDCVKGLANGKGTAKGKDVYIGEFRKGLPHGRGSYQWSTGERYFGDFKKGKRDGMGIFLYFEDGHEKVAKGQWTIDRFIREDIRASYHVREDFGIFNQRATIDPQGNSVLFYFEQKGLPDKTISFKSYAISTGKMVDVTARALNTMVMFDEITTFPVIIRIEYSRKSLDNFLDVNCFFDVEIFEPGTWEFHLEHYR